MAILAFRRFAGGQPRLNPRLLDPRNAARVSNAQFENGKLRAYKRSTKAFTSLIPGPLKSVYFYRGGSKTGWLSWASDVDVVRAPLAGDDYGRIYFTGAGRPKFGDSESLITPKANATGTTLGGATTIVVNRNRGFQAGDPILITYAPGITANATCTGFAPSGQNGILQFTPPTATSTDTTTTFTNMSGSYPILSYDLGVPAPTVAPTATIVSGGVDGGTGSKHGDILAVEDIVLATSTHTDTATVDNVQDGNSAFSSWGLGKHNPYNTLTGVVTDGSPIVVSVDMDFAVKLNFTPSETRDVQQNMVRDPSGANLKIKTQTTRISRPFLSLGAVSVGALDSVNPWHYQLHMECIDVPAGGTHSYRFDFSPVPGIMGDGNNSYPVAAVWTWKVTQTNKVKLKLATGHGLTVGEKIKLTLVRTPDTSADHDLNGQTVEVLEVSGDYVTIAGVYGGKYDAGGTWQKSYTTTETSDRSYVYTYVASINGQEFESAPSPPTEIVTTSLDGTVRVSGFVNPTSPSLLWDTNFTGLRLYRLNPGETVKAEYLYLADIAIDATQYDDAAAGDTLGEVLKSTLWELPPDDLQGIIELPEGGAAGFTAKEFCMAEPYYLHAWPALNRRTTHDEIVWVGAFGTSIAITTKGRPYVVTGIDPATVTMERIETSMPNLSKRGSVDMGYACVYPSTDGLVSIAIGRADVCTMDVFSPEEWQKLNPASFVATRYKEKYIAFYDNGKEKGGFVLNPNDPSHGVVFLDFWGDELWTDGQTNKVYFTRGQDIFEFNADVLEMQYSWLSKPITMPSDLSFGWGKVDAKRYPVRFTVLADGEPIYSREVLSSDAFRLPPHSSSVWQIELQGCHEVEAVYLAERSEDFLSLGEG